MLLNDCADSPSLRESLACRSCACVLVPVPSWVLLHPEFFNCLAAPQDSSEDDDAAWASSEGEAQSVDDEAAVDSPTGPVGSGDYYSGRWKWRSSSFN